jgi:hypothetical protein
MEIFPYKLESASYQFSLVLDLLFIIQFSHFCYFINLYLADSSLRIIFSLFFLVRQNTTNYDTLANKILQYVEDFVFRRSYNIEESNYIDCNS